VVRRNFFIDKTRSGQRTREITNRHLLIVHQPDTTERAARIKRKKHTKIQHKP
jgi:hypothetical protein